MFVASIKRVDDRQARMIFRISADTLSIAESYLVKVLAAQYSTTNVVLIYVDDLVYHVYTDGVFGGVVWIKLEG